MDFSMTYIWLAAMIILLIIEAIVPGLVSIWFALGSLAALIVSALKGPVWLQIIVFVVVSVASLILTKPLAKKYVNSRIQATNADSVIGKECIVTGKIDNINGTGSAKVDGKEWTARSYSDEIIIEKGAKAQIESIEGVKIVVRPLEK